MLSGMKYTIGAETMFQKKANTQAEIMVDLVLLLQRPCAQSTRLIHGAVGFSACSRSFLFCRPVSNHTPASAPNPASANTKPNSSGMMVGRGLPSRSWRTPEASANRPNPQKGSANRDRTKGATLLDRITA